MARTRFTYNTETCKYEPFYVRGKALGNRIFIFLSLSFVLAFCGYFWLINHYVTIDEIMLEEKNKTLKIEWDILHDRVEQADRSLAELVEKDDHNYRVILDSHPLSSSIRNAGVGGSERINKKLLKEFPIILDELTTVEKLRNQMDVQVQSFKEIEKLLDIRIQMWASRPAIQPINNQQLRFLHTTFGLREHPLLKIFREHKGLDFTAEEGTPVYATGDGKVAQAYYSDSYGKVIFLEHGFEYETRYAHLSEWVVTEGQNVKRGEIIGYVGDTGTSAGSHLHYEVLFKGVHVNPINFFQRDLSNKEYEKLIEEGSKHINSLD
jgi:murein DD-endopeptidase MepM/ murein hydrolase activator NlpD